MSKIYGYARCSLAEEKGQDLNRQVRELKEAGAEEIITEREHGDTKVKQNLDLGLFAFLLPDFAKFKGVIRMVATQFQQSHVLRSIQGAGSLGKLLGQDDLGLEVVNFIARVLSHSSILPFFCSRL